MTTSIFSPRLEPVTRAIAASLLAMTLCLTGSAVASGAPRSPRPFASTGSTRATTASSSRLSGLVNPHGVPSDFYFQYGPSTRYGSATAPDPSAGARSANVAVAATVTNLAAFTTYHYRIVAVSAGGTSRGADRTFTTSKIPLSLAIAASPQIVLYGLGTSLVGNLNGTGGGNREVVLQASAFPYSSGFANVGNAEVTSPSGGFSFPVASLLINTQFRVVTVSRPTIVSPVASGLVAVVVRARARVRRRRRGALVRFRGTVAPAETGALVAVQKLVRHTWVTVGMTSAHPAGPGRSRFSRRVRVRRGGFFRVLVEVNDGGHQSNASALVHVAVRR